MDLRLQEAEIGVAALNAALESQRLSGKVFGGGIHVNRETSDRVSKFLGEDPIAIALMGSDVKFSAASNSLLLAYEELRRRRNLTPDIDSKWVYRKLVTRLAANAKAFNTLRLKKLITASLFSTGGVYADIFKEQEFKAFHDKKYVINHAVRGYPLNPRKFLHDVLKTISKITDEKEFKDSLLSPSLILHAALYHPRDPRKFLRGVLKIVARLLSNPEFKDFHDCPYVIMRAASHHSTNPEKFLRILTEKQQKILADQEIASLFKNQPSYVIRALLYHSGGPIRFLKKAIANYQSIRADSSFQDLHEHSSFVLSVCVDHHIDPKGLLKSALEFRKKILADQRFKELHGLPQFILTTYVKDKEHARRTLLEEVRRIRGGTKAEETEESTHQSEIALSA